MRFFNAIHRFFQSLTIVTIQFGCSSPPHESLTSARYGKSYDVLSSCAYSRLLDEGRVGVTYADLKAQRAVVIREVNQSVVIWDARIESAPGGGSIASVKSVPTIRGGSFYADQVLTVLRQCAGQ